MQFFLSQFFLMFFSIDILSKIFYSVFSSVHFRLCPSVTPKTISLEVSMQEVKPLVFLNNGTAVVQMPNCRMATALRDFFYDSDFGMKSQTSKGKLTLRIPSPPSDHTEEQVKNRMSDLYGEFCRRNNLRISG